MIPKEQLAVLLITFSSAILTITFNSHFIWSQKCRTASQKNFQGIKICLTDPEWKMNRKSLFLLSAINKAPAVLSSLSFLITEEPNYTAVCCNLCSFDWPNYSCMANEEGSLPRFISSTDQRKSKCISPFSWYWSGGLSKHCAYLWFILPESETVTTHTQTVFHQYFTHKAKAELLSDDSLLALYVIDQPRLP